MIPDLTGPHNGRFKSGYVNAVGIHLSFKADGIIRFVRLIAFLIIAAQMIAGIKLDPREVGIYFHEPAAVRIGHHGCLVIVTVSPVDAIVHIDTA